MQAVVDSLPERDESQEKGFCKLTAETDSSPSTLTRPSLERPRDRGAIASLP